eukprot:jgi/Psemu1/12461/gm1.12461_g
MAISGGSSGRGLSGPITPQVTTPQVTNVTEGGKLKRKVNSLQHPDYSSSDSGNNSDTDDSLTSIS